MSKAWKITLLSVGTLLLLVVIASALFLWKIRSIDLEDIQNRRLVQAEQTGNESEKGQASLPSSLEGAVDKASDLAGKSVNAEDAMDVASILLNSGLSFREMYYLLGQSTETLSTEEKQRIRDLLLKKLTTEEIKALRSITKDYGKYLVIVDPDYPIEAVGVEDKAERQRILQEVADRKAAEGTVQSDGAGGKETATSGTGGKESKPDVQQTGNTGTTGQGAKQPQQPQKPVQKDTTVQSGKETDSDKAKQKKEQQELARKEKQLNEKYTAELEKVKTGCVNRANELLSSLLSNVGNDDGEGALGSSDPKLFNEISAAEASCDQQYADLKARAEAEFKSQKLTFKAASAWEREYNSTKEEIRGQAMSQIMKEMKG
ncbi:hypothetical protein EBB07_06180 [Paenibacillaceae bacterium]|nr:hypothetical protein EBB07_06180 [Paenibacillaceae bacterium]